MKEIKKQQKYLKYYRDNRIAGKMPKTYAQWLSGGKTTTKRTDVVSDSLKRAGLSDDDIKRLKGK